LAYGTDGTGFEQPAFPSRDKAVVLGLVSTHDQRVETPDELVRSVETATAFINEDQLAIGPQCGFAGLSAITTFPRKRSGESSTP